MKLRNSLFAGLLAGFTAVATGWVAHDIWNHGPHCPTEDSCTVDYHDGTWEIIEVTP